MESALYECTAMHHRLRPKEHRFAYKVFYLWADLDELPALDRALKFFSHNRRGIFSLMDADHLAEKGGLKESILAFIAEGGVDATGIRHVRLLTLPRIFGYIFNPVCFYYGYGNDGIPVCAVAEVTNTFHEKKRFLLTKLDPRGRFHLVTPKHFYVSPFSRLDLLFDFRLAAPGPALDIHIDDEDAEGAVLLTSLTSLTGSRRPLTDGALAAFIFKYPLLTLRVIFLIHWQALRLWLKRVPWHRKSEHPKLQTNLHPPH